LIINIRVYPMFRNISLPPPSDSVPLMM